MAINVPAAWTNWANGTPKAFLDILTLEGGQGKLPINTQLMAGSLGVYAVLQSLDHLPEHSFLGSIGFGLASAGLVGGLTALLLPRYDARDRVVQTITALAGVGAVIALASIVLHFVFAIALPPPLPTARLVSFLLFPLCIWNFFAFAYIYRHGKLRNFPAFALSATFVIIVDFILAKLLH
ncbi:hypothetical protein [Methylocystis bryophila]|uniref:Yip1 domain-containing protein n=1 Tax=Methylocystis bryophila TaxID=655015 RepID=A0A1W6N173_9HYPH|nr:hypothetical protein [Methylocystis bryophila]ARN83612.1 hypothetical protein B1812_12480 [Methylocystis bryophila]BDV37817.1 hypothetical protein DSM21852_10700 [Methylocystis bryophila]